MRKSRKKNIIEFVTTRKTFVKARCLSELLCMAQNIYIGLDAKPIGRGIVLNKNKKPRILTLAKVAYQNSSEDTNYRVVMWQAMQIMLRSAVV
ncbi:hypothetical protein [Limosilactobacillus equigenerosi]|uniref:hypothetical protein n=1 Tax=Limosilactobacillus equigenerosi TaxID=417373 RepID=UPI0006D2812A|nr:hypothetical protein [Limosilactobacillus equigenerosi]